MRLAIASCLVLAACSSSSASSPDAPPAPLAPELGASGAVTFTDVYVTKPETQLVDLAFHPERDEIWAVGYGDDSTHIGQGVLGASPTWKRIVDPAAKHFMHKPPAIAMGAAPFWATCGDNDNGQNAEHSDGTANLFMGPALFTTDPAIFGKRTPQGLGSHMDMLHNTPFCRGIAHVEANVYWVFNAYDRSLDRYDFAQDHGPGNDDHADGTIHRYAQGQVRGADDGTPSHVAYDPSDGFLYVADTGNARVVRLDTTKGTKGAELPRQNEPLAEGLVMEGTAVEEVVPPGVLTKPSGLEVRSGLVYVGDAETGTLHAFDKAGKEVRRLATELPPGSLAGFVFGPDGKIYFADRGGRIVRVDP